MACVAIKSFSEINMLFPETGFCFPKQEWLRIPPLWQHPGTPPAGITIGAEVCQIITAKSIFPSK